MQLGDEGFWNRAFDCKSQRNAGSLHQHAALFALLAPIRRLRPGFFVPGSGAFVIARSAASRDQSMPFRPSYSISPCRKKASNTPASFQSLKRRYAELHEQIPVASSAFHWHPVRSTNSIPFMAFRSGIRGLWQPNGCGLRGGSSGSIRPHRSSDKRHTSFFLAGLIFPSNFPVAALSARNCELKSGHLFWLLTPAACRAAM